LLLLLLSTFSKGLLPVPEGSLTVKHLVLFQH